MVVVRRVTCPGFSARPMRCRLWDVQAAPNPVASFGQPFVRRGTGRRQLTASPAMGLHPFPLRLRCRALLAGVAPPCSTFAIPTGPLRPVQTESPLTMQYITRAQWGAREPVPGVVIGPGLPKWIIHHFAMPDLGGGATAEQEVAAMRQVDTDHWNKGWGGIGYQWVVFQSGRIYEGRGWGRSGAHTVGQNHISTAICFGINSMVHHPTDAAWSAAASIVVEGERTGRVNPKSRFTGHREYRFAAPDCPGGICNNTSCPGDKVFSELWRLRPLPHGRFFIQGTFGRKGNFEMVLSRLDSGINHCWRDNDNPVLPWNHGGSFGLELGRVGAVALLQSNFGVPGSLHAIARYGDRLAHYELTGPGWQRRLDLPITGTTGPAVVIQSSYGIKGNFELTVPLNTGVACLWRNNDDPATPWNRSPNFAEELGRVGSIALIQSNMGQPGNLHCLALYGGRLAHYERIGGSWNRRPDVGPEGVWGSVGFIQGRYGRKGNLEVVVAFGAGGLEHWWLDTSAPEAGRAWNLAAPGRFAREVQVGAVSLLESNFGTPGNLEIVGRMSPSAEVVHRWRRNESSEWIATPVPC